MYDINIIWRNIRLPILMLTGTFVFGSLGYKIIFPEQSWVKVFLMTAITLSTVGYGDILNVESSTIGAWYTMVLMIVGMGIVLYSISVVTAYVVEGSLGKVLSKQSMNRKINKLKNHYVICGAGSTGVHVVREMSSQLRPFVVIENDAEKIEQLKLKFENCLFIEGDATSDQVLRDARINEAIGLVAALPSDKDNLFLTVSARLQNHTMKIVAKTSDPKMAIKLEKAGANYSVSPNLIGGLRIASEILRPHVVSFLDRMLRGKDKSIRIEEAIIQAKSPFVGKKLEKSNIWEQFGLKVIAYSPTGKDEDFQYNPTKDTLLHEGGVIVFIANAQQSREIRKVASII